MQIEVIDFVFGVGMALLLEGLFYAAFPEQAKKMITQVLQSPIDQLRIMGLIVAIIGLAIIMAIK